MASVHRGCGGGGEGFLIANSSKAKPLTTSKVGWKQDNVDRSYGGCERSQSGIQDGGNKQAAGDDERLTSAERWYLEQRQQLEVQRLVKVASKSHRDWIQVLNQYLADLSEHYDSPKVGPG
ncbi:hypothetical protein Ancab_001794 [Ancistrocladus abbreviatus]